VAVRNQEELTLQRCQETKESDYKKKIKTKEVLAKESKQIAKPLESRTGEDLPAITNDFLFH
jgi:hypothetical protein